MYAFSCGSFLTWVCAHITSFLWNRQFDTCWTELIAPICAVWSVDCLKKIMLWKIFSISMNKAAKRHAKVGFSWRVHWQRSQLSFSLHSACLTWLDFGTLTNKHFYNPSSQHNPTVQFWIKEHLCSGDFLIYIPVICLTLCSHSHRV